MTAQPTTWRKGPPWAPGGRRQRRTARPKSHHLDANSCALPSSHLVRSSVSAGRALSIAGRCAAPRATLASRKACKCGPAQPPCNPVTYLRPLLAAGCLERAVPIAPACFVQGRLPDAPCTPTHPRRSRRQGVHPAAGPCAAHRRWQQTTAAAHPDAQVPRQRFCPRADVFRLPGGPGWPEQRRGAAGPAPAQPAGGVGRRHAAAATPGARGTRR